MIHGKSGKGPKAKVAATQQEQGKPGDKGRKETTYNATGTTATDPSAQMMTVSQVIRQLAMPADQDGEPAFRRAAFEEEFGNSAEGQWLAKYLLQSNNPCANVASAGEDNGAESQDDHDEDLRATLRTVHGDPLRGPLGQRVGV